MLYRLEEMWNDAAVEEIKEELPVKKETKKKKI